MSRKAGALAAFLVLCACSSVHSPPRDLDNACAIVAEKPGYLRAMQRSEHKWGVPVAVQMATIYQESKFVSNAKTPHKRFLFIPLGRVSSAKGYSQALDGTWEDYRSATGNRLASRSNIDDATDFIGWYMASTQQNLGIPLTDASNHYLAYHEGRSGYSRGTHKSKPWLLDVADSVEARAIIYDRQLQGCGGV